MAGGTNRNFGDILYDSDYIPIEWRTEEEWIYDGYRPFPNETPVKNIYSKKTIYNGVEVNQIYAKYYYHSDQVYRCNKLSEN